LGLGAISVPLVARLHVTHLTGLDAALEPWTVVFAIIDVAPKTNKI